MTLHPFSVRLRRNIALCALLPSLLIACGAPDENAADEAVEASDAALEDEAADTYVVDEGADDGYIVDVVEVPVAIETSTDTTPLSDAALIARLIAAGDGIQRVRHGDGWAWRRQGRIIRTASADGKEVAYFRNGSETPFLVQHDNRAYAYSNGAVTRTYDRNGRAQTPDTRDRQEATELVREARDDRDRAERVASNQAPSRGDDRGTSRQRPPERSAATPAPDGNQRQTQQRSSRPPDNADRTSGGDRRSSPSPSPSPSRRLGPGERDSSPR